MSKAKNFRAKKIKKSLKSVEKLKKGWKKCSALRRRRIHQTPQLVTPTNPVFPNEGQLKHSIIIISISKSIQRNELLDDDDYLERTISQEEQSDSSDSSSHGDLSKVNGSSNESISHSEDEEDYSLDEFDADPGRSHSIIDEHSQKEIYPNSGITLLQFALYFIWLCNRLKMNQRTRSTLLKFIKFVLPINNNLPLTYKTLLKLLVPKEQRNTTVQVCNLCKETIENCRESSCQSKGKDSFRLVEFDVASQLADVYKRESYCALEYKGLWLDETQNMSH